jgi:NitT/TauT family transport system permease protein
MREALRQTAAIVVVLGTLLVLWHLAAHVVDQPRLLPGPEAVAATVAAGIFGEPLGSPRSLIYHAGVTASTTVAGFAIALGIGIALAFAIVHVRILDRALLPWIVASQTVPVLAIAPMVVVVLGNAGLTGMLPKALIAAWLAFFPIVTAMVTGLRSPETIQLDLMRTYSASRREVFAKVRWPASMPFAFAGVKVALTLALVGAIVAELPTGAQAGLGARLLSASYYGQTLQLWAALVMAAVLALVAVALADGARLLLIRSRGGRL